MHLCSQAIAQIDFFTKFFLRRKKPKRAANFYDQRWTSKITLVIPFQKHKNFTFQNVTQLIKQQTNYNIIFYDE